MKTKHKWFCMLSVALTCASSSLTHAADFNEPVFRPPLIQQVSAQQTIAPATPPAPQPVPTSRWETNESEAVAPAVNKPVAAMAPGNFTSFGGDCGDACYDPGIQFIAGIEATFFFPQFSREFLRTGFNNSLGAVDIVDNAALGSTDGSLLMGPRVTLGFQGDVWGVVGRYWYSSNWAHNFTPAFPDAVQSGIKLFDNFNLYTLDLEIQRRFCWRNWDMFGFGGVRYASVNNDRSLWIQNSFGSDLVESAAYSGQQFNGTGITFGVFGLRPLFCDDGALKAYFTNRYSILWGNGLATAQTTVSAQNAGGAFESTDGAMAGGDGDLFIAEVGFGLQWEANLCCLPGRAFFRTGVEWQYWDANAGVSAISGSIADAGTASSYAYSQVGDLLFDMVGLTIGEVITY